MFSAAAPLGSQFAVAHTHPQRAGLITGHRIPLGLFPIETQNRILGLPEPSSSSGKYVETSSFRRPARLAVVALPPTVLTPPASVQPSPDAASFLLTPPSPLQTPPRPDTASSLLTPPPSSPTPALRSPKEFLSLDYSLSAFGHPSLLDSL